MLATDGFAKLQPFYGKSSLINVVLETPKGAPYKLKYDEETGTFRVHKAMPLGFVFPFNFGFIPGTMGGDGDPLDVLLLTEYVMPAGAVVLGQLIAVLEAVQIENKKKEKNDRLIAVPMDDVERKPMQPAVDFNAGLKSALVEFFVKYNELEGRTFRPLGYASAKRAMHAVHKSIRAKE